MLSKYIEQTQVLNNLVRKNNRSVKLFPREKPSRPVPDAKCPVRDAISHFKNMVRQNIWRSYNIIVGHI